MLKSLLFTRALRRCTSLRRSDSLAFVATTLADLAEVVAEEVESLARDLIVGLRTASLTMEGFLVIEPTDDALFALAIPLACFSAAISSAVRILPSLRGRPGPRLTSVEWTSESCITLGVTDPLASVVD